MSWITIDDAVSAINYAIATDSLSGPVNVVSPNPAVVPPTWLPCPLQSSGLGSGCGTGWNAGSLGLAL